MSIMATGPHQTLEKELSNVAPSVSIDPTFDPFSSVPEDGSFSSDSVSCKA